MRDWFDFKCKHGIETARSEFEKVCGELFKIQYKNTTNPVQRIAVSRGDGGIDICVGNIGIEPITLIQCKFFINDFNDAQKQQIIRSFKTARESKEYSFSKWILCIPRVLTKDELLNWNRWKNYIAIQFSFPLEEIILYDGDWLISRLKDYGLYNRIFGLDEIKKLDEIYTLLSSIVEKNSDDKKITQNNSYQKSLLKISYIISKDINLCNASKKQCFDMAVFAVIDSNYGINIADIAKRVYTGSSSIDIPQIRASIQRLKKSGYISGKDDFFSTDAFMSNSVIYDDFNKLTEYILTHIKNGGYCIPENCIVAARNNISNAILYFFKMYSYDIAVEDYKVQPNDFGELPTILSNGISKECGQILNAAIAEIIIAPEQEIASVLMRIRRCFLGVRFLGLDSDVRENNKHIFSQNRYLLDTAFVLDLLVKDTRRSPAYRKIVSFLFKHGAEVIIAKELLDEVINHAKYADRQYAYIAYEENNTSLEILLGKVNNAFIEGYLLFKETDSTITFDKYVRNYYHPQHTTTFLVDFINNEITECNDIKFISFAEATLNNEAIRLKALMLPDVVELTLKTSKSNYRPDEENRQIAENDIMLYLSCLYSKILFTDNKSCYAISDSTRALRVAKKWGAGQCPYIKPTALLNYFESQDPAGFSYNDVMSACLNPFLYTAVNEMWPSIERLVQLGGDLRGIGLTKLKYDLQDNTQQILQHNPEDPVSAKELNFIATLRPKGYKFAGELSKLIEDSKELSLLRAKITELEMKQQKKEKYDKKYFKLKKK